MSYIIANWKAEMNLTSVNEWLQQFSSLLNHDSHLEKNIEVIICPPAPFLLTVKESLRDYPFIKIGAQTVSTAEEGKFTGEITVKALKGVVDYAIIGHSERRSHFHESEEDIKQQLSLCEKYNIRSILCVRNTQDVVYENATIIAYEPTDSIGTGHNAYLKDVISFKNKLETSKPFLYGGSVDEDNCSEYLSSSEIQGLLVGTASLNPRTFYEMVETYLK